MVILQICENCKKQIRTKTLYKYKKIITYIVNNKNSKILRKHSSEERIQSKRSIVSDWALQNEHFTSLSG